MFNIPSFIGARGGAKAPFEFTINTANLSTGSTADNQFKLPLVDDGNILEAKVDWGDGTSDLITTYNQAETTHTYPSVGTYTIKITGDLSGWQFNNGGDRLKMLNVIQWAGLNISVDSGFSGCNNLTATATDAPLITSTSLSGYFSLCTNFNGDVGNWDVSNVSNFYAMFNFADQFNNGGSPNINNWDTSSAELMHLMFRNATNFNQPIGNWNTSMVNQTYSMFENASSFNQDISTKVINAGQPNEYIAWDVSNVSTASSMKDMFNGATAFNQNIGSWDVSNVKNFSNMFNNATAFNNGGSDDINNWTINTASAVNMSGMFQSATAFNQNIGDWNTSAVTSMSSMFQNASSFNQNIGSWNVSSVTGMLRMFLAARTFNQDIGGWNVSSVITFAEMFGGAWDFNNGNSDSIKNWQIKTTGTSVNMSNMFLDTLSFNQPIGSWNVSNVTNMNSMFRNATAFNQDIGSWNISNVTNIENFMRFKSSANYEPLYLDSIYNNWSQLTLQPNLNISFGSIQYTVASAIGKNKLLNSPNNWVISDGGQNEPFQFTVQTDNAGVSSSTEFRMPLTTSTDLGFTVNWGDGVTETITDHTLAVHDYGVAGTYTITVTGSILGWRFNNGGDRLKMLNVLKWSGLNISVNGGFFGCTNLTATAVDAPLITSTSLFALFSQCSNFNGLVNNWDVSSVTNFAYIFEAATAFNQPIGSWNVSNATSLEGLFFQASTFNQDIGGWDVSKVTTFAATFDSATAFNNGNLDSIKNWILKNTGTINMLQMFSGATAFNQNIGAWNVSNVTTMQNMFNGATTFNQNIGNWNVSNVSTFLNMFYNATAFNNGGSDDINNWTIKTTGTVNMSGMFGGNSTGASCKFNRYIGDWNTSAVTNMSGMFARNTAFNQNIGSWNTSAVINIAGMFFQASAFNQNIGSWNISAVTSLSAIFLGATLFNNGGSADINNWNTTNVTNMAQVFQSATSFNQPIGSWDVSVVQNMNNMFNNASSFNQDIGSWNTSSVTNMSNMFSNTTIFNQNLGAWDVSSVTNMANMFANATAFNQNIGAWNVSNVNNFTNFMFLKSAADYSATNLDSIYNGWSSRPVQPNININFGSIKYTAAGQAGKDILTNAPNLWVVVDGGI